VHAAYDINPHRDNYQQEASLNFPFFLMDRMALDDEILFFTSRDVLQEIGSSDISPGHTITTESIKTDLDL
jgi:hypothetical protein